MALWVETLDVESVVVRVAEVDLAHVDPGEVRVGLGLEDPVGVGEGLVGSANATGVAVVVDGDGVAQGLSLVVKFEGPVDVRVDYLKTATALVFLRPGIATSDPLLSLATVWVLSGLPELGVLADQLEADAARFGNSYLVDLSADSEQALLDTVDAFFEEMGAYGGVEGSAGVLVDRLGIVLAVLC